MFKKALIGVVVIVAVLAAYIATRPSDFRVERSLAMSAPASVIFAQVNDFHKWGAWDPWAKMDPAAKNTFEGPPAGEGAIFRWEGNKDVGAGSMTLVNSHPSDLIRIQLDFLKPFKGSDTAEFTFKPEGNQTVVTWSMYGKNNFIAKAIGLFIDCDKMIGGQYEKGLAAMKTLVETAPKK